MLASAAELRHVGEASNGADALKAIGALKPDLVLMDVHMPEMDGPATARAVLAKYPATKVVAWTVSESSDDLLRMIQAGCSGYVLKDVGPAELQRALLSALRSESPVPRRMIPDVLRRVAESTRLSRTFISWARIRSILSLRSMASVSPTFWMPSTHSSRSLMRTLNRRRCPALPSWDGRTSENPRW